jgi:hypothetical protein
MLETANLATAITVGDGLGNEGLGNEGLGNDGLGNFVVDAPSRRVSTAWLHSDWLIVLLCVFAGVPLVMPHLPALTDLGGHLGRFAVQIDGGASPSLRQWYSFHWGLIPNLGTDLLMQLLAPRMGLEPALKAIVIAIPVIQTAGFLLLARVVHGQVTPTTLLALPLAYGYPLQYGFLNFTLCMALGTCALALWIGLGQRDRNLARWLIFVPIACTLWVCHFAGWALFCVFAGSNELAVWRARGFSWFAGCRRAAPALSCLLVPGLVGMAWPGAQRAHGPTSGYFDVVAKLGWIVMPFRDRWAVWDVASALLLIGIIGWTWWSRWFSRHDGLVLGTILTGCAFVLLPRHVAGTSFADLRLVPMILAMALIAVRAEAPCPPRIVEALAIGGLIFVGARLTGNAVSQALFDRQFSQDLTALDAVPRDAQLVSLTVNRCGTYEPWLRDRRTHLAGYALARRHAFANDQWVMPGGQLLRVHNPAAGSFSSDMSQLVSAESCEGKPGLWARVASIPAAMRSLWLIENGVPRRFAGWHPIRQTPGTVVYSRD